MAGILPTESNVQMAGAGVVGAESAGLSSRIAFADLPALMGVYTTDDVDAIISGLTFLTSADIDTLAEINAILGDATLVDQSRTITAGTGLTGGGDLSANLTISLDAASVASLALADSALQPGDITSGTVTAGTADIDLTSGSTGDVLTQQADGSFAMSAAAGGGSPGGSSGQLQYNNAGAFGGTTAIVYAGSGSHVTITAQSATDKPLIIKAAASQSANLQEWQNSSGTNLSYIDSSGRLCVGYAGLRAASGPTNRWIDIGSKWSNNLATEIYSLSQVIIRAANTLSGFFFKNETLSGVIWGLGDKTLTFQGWDTDAVPNRGVCDVIVCGGSAHANGQTNTSQTVRGGKLTLKGGNGSSNATTAAADGGDIELTPGSHYGTGRAGLVLISSLPTSDPAVSGALWNDSGTLKISAG